MGETDGHGADNRDPKSKGETANASETWDRLTRTLADQIPDPLRHIKESLAGMVPTRLETSPLPRHAARTNELLEEVVSAGRQSQKEAVDARRRDRRWLVVGAVGSVVAALGAIAAIWITLATR